MTWQIPEAWKQPDGGLDGYIGRPIDPSLHVSFEPPNNVALVDGYATPAQLRAIADHIEKHQEG